MDNVLGANIIAFVRKERRDNKNSVYTASGLVRFLRYWFHPYKLAPHNLMCKLLVCITYN